MNLQSRARVGRFESIEIGAIAVIVLASLAQSFFLYRLVPELASLYAGVGEPWSLRLRVYVALCNWALIVVPVILVTAVGFQFAGRPRDLSYLGLVSGEPDQVIALLEPKVSRDNFVTEVRYGAPGQAFLLGEAYREKGDIPTARRFYLRAQQAAASFDAGLTPHLVEKQARWQAKFGRDYDFWLPKASEMKVLSDRVRAVSQQRLDQLSQ